MVTVAFSSVPGFLPCSTFLSSVDVVSSSSSKTYNWGKPRRTPYITTCVNSDDQLPVPVPKAPSKDDLVAPKRLTRRRRVTKKTTSFEAAIDNMTMKRMGRGTIYYGEKMSVDEDAPAFLASKDEEEEELKPDSVLVIGGTGQTGLWITLGLLTQGFNVRVLTRKFSRAETLFGPSGSNVDVFEGDVNNLDDVREAVDGATAIVYAAAPSPAWFPPASKAIDVDGVQNIVTAASESSTTIRRIVLLSASGSSSIAKSKLRAENIIKNSSIPYAIVRAAQLSLREGGTMKIEIAAVIGDNPEESSGNSISRVDAAQCICQCLVQERRIVKMSEEDPEAGFEFPSCIFSVRNSAEPFTPDKRFWTKSFNQILDRFRENVDMAP